MNARTPISTPVKEKPAPPWTPFPLYWHQRGYWMCKRDGEEWRYEADGNESYRRYVLDMEARAKGSLQTAPGRRKRKTLRDAINVYLTRQKQRWEDGDLSDVQFLKCRKELEKELRKSVALSVPLDVFRSASPDDARPGEMFGKIRRKAKARGLSAMHRHVVMVRACLDYAAKKKLMLPPDYGDDFDPPTKSAIDKARNAADVTHGERSWTIEELRKIVAEAKSRKRNPHLYAQILLALFAGFGSDDCSAVPEGAFLKDRGVVKFRRAKNGRPRVVALPQVVWQAIEASKAQRERIAKNKGLAPAPQAAHLLFRTEGGTPCNQAERKIDPKTGIIEKLGRNDNIGQSFERLVHKLDLQRYRAGFKTLRAMCRTLMLGANIDPDLMAVVMGRKFRYDVDEYYIRGDLREKMFALAGHIENQLFPPVKQTG